MNRTTAISTLSSRSEASALPLATRWKTAGTISATPLSANIVDPRLAAVRLNRCVWKRTPPRSTVKPKTRRTFPMIDPVIEAFTRSCKPARKARRAMINSATFGNAAELIIALLAVRAGLQDLVKASITGSIIGNVLLVFGLTVLLGGVRFQTQRFNRTAASLGSTMLALSGVALIVPAV